MDAAKVVTKLERIEYVEDPHLGKGSYCVVERHPDGGVGDLPPEVLPVHFKPSLHLPQGRRHQLHAIIHAGVEEEAVGRGHGQHLAMVGLHQILHDLIQSRDNAGGEGQLLTGKTQS